MQLLADREETTEVRSAAAMSLAMARHKPAGKLMRRIVNDALATLDEAFARLYSYTGRPSIPPEMLLRALLLQAFYTIRSERQLMEQLDYNLLFRWFVGLGVDDPVWVATVFSKNRDRLLEAEQAPVGDDA